MTHTSRFLSAAVLLVSVAACKDKVSIARADSLQGQLTEQQTLSNQLNAQKDSLTRVVLDADAFLGQMDSAISTVRGLPRSKRSSSESPLADQIAARKEMMTRVSALVARAKQTSAQLAELQKKNALTEEENAQLKTKIEADAQLIADLGSTIERQTGQIAMLEASVDSLNTEMKTLGTRHYKAYYVIGTEDELMEKGLIVKEGGANLLIVRPGRTLQPARVLNPEAFTSIDQREMKEITVPDTSAHYRLVSRQSLDAAEVAERNGTSFKGNLKIADPNQFWGPSRFLILVKL
jgi:cell division protein FtsB